VIFETTPSKKVSFGKKYARREETKDGEGTVATPTQKRIETRQNLSEPFPRSARALTTTTPTKWSRYLSNTYVYRGDTDTLVGASPLDSFGVSLRARRRDAVETVVFSSSAVIVSNFHRGAFWRLKRLFDSLGR
jgi:hypothetical protein